MILRATADLEEIFDILRICQQYVTGGLSWPQVKSLTSAF